MKLPGVLSASEVVRPGQPQRLEVPATDPIPSGYGMAGWGGNYAGELGREVADTAVDRPSPAGSGDLGGAAVSLVSSNTGGYHNCAVKGSQLYCWGEGLGLGNGSREDSTRAVKVDMTGVMAGTSVTKVQTAYGSTCAVASGKAFCWGEWWVTGTGDYSDVPQQIGGLLDGKTVTDIAVLDTGVCAIADGKPYCWGGDQYGQNGDGQVTRFNQAPVAVDISGVLAGKQVTNIVGGYFTACAIADARAYCWGSNWNGELGNGTSHDSGVDQSSVPVAVGGDLANMDVTAISIDYADCAIAGGKAYCWGYGSSLLGTGISYSYPMKETLPKPVDASGVLAGKTVTHIATGDNAGCVLADGKPYCWGINYDSALSTAIAPDATAWSPVAIDLTGTILEGKEPL